MKPSDYRKMVKVCLYLVCFMVLTTGFHWWDPVARWMGIGNEAMENGEPEKADSAYAQAEKAAPGDERILYNQALAKLSTEKTEEALELLEKASGSNDPEIQANAFYNKGCIELQSGNPRAAAESMEQVLKIRPDDTDAKVNLEIARKILEQMPTPTPPPNDQQSDQNSNGEDNQEQQQDQQQQEQQQQEQDQQEQDQQEQDQQQEQSMPTPTPAAGDESKQEQNSGKQESREPEEVEEGKMSKMEAERLLDAQEEDEMEVLKRFHQLPPVRDREIDKDW